MEKDQFLSTTILCACLYLLLQGHVVMLGPGCEEAAFLALRTFPNQLQIGGGINAGNAKKYIDAGASHIIVTSAVFRDGSIDYDALRAIQAAVGKDKIVLDLSCRRKKTIAAEQQQREDDNHFYGTVSYLYAGH